jgi:predicted adenylyl cyclase CyaB
MPANIEIKAKAKDLDELQRLVEQISDTPCATLLQEDTFFNTSRGRLKLRVMAPDHGELIYYVRDDATGPKRSDYAISMTCEPDTLKAVLAAAWGIRGVVRKQRRLYTVANTRVHLDDVEGLGTYMELEVVLSAGQSEQQGHAVAAELMDKLGIQASDLIDVAYIDLFDNGLA